MSKDHKVRPLSADEACVAYRTAKRAKNVYAPINLVDAWRRLRSNHSLPAFVADLRELIKDPVLDDPSVSTGYPARFVELMVVGFERLVTF